MRRFAAPLVVVAVVLLGLAPTGGLRTAAQEATPAVTPNLTVGTVIELASLEDIGSARLPARLHLARPS